MKIQPTEFMVLLITLGCILPLRSFSKYDVLYSFMIFLLANVCRKRLFNMINELPTIFEVVTGTTKKQAKEKSSVSNHSSSKSKSNSKVRKNFCRPSL